MRESHDDVDNRWPLLIVGVLITPTKIKNEQDDSRPNKLGLDGISNVYDICRGAMKKLEIYYDRLTKESHNDGEAGFWELWKVTMVSGQFCITTSFWPSCVVSLTLRSPREC